MLSEKGRVLQAGTQKDRFHLTGTGLEGGRRAVRTIHTGGAYSRQPRGIPGEKLDRFEDAIPRKGVVPNSRLATAVESIQPLGQPTDRLSQELLENYAALIQQPQLVCEIELLSLLSGRTQQRNELQEFRRLLKTELDRDRVGAFFEHEEIKGTCRVVIRCTGQLFRHLVEDAVAGSGEFTGLKLARSSRLFTAWSRTLMSRVLDGSAVLPRMRK